MITRATAVAAAIAVLVGLSAPAVGASGSPLLGVYYGNQGWNMTEVQALETWQGKRDAVLNLFTNWDSSTHTITNLFSQQLPAIWANHNVPMITWQPFTGNTTPSNIDTQIAGGAFDGYVGTWADRLKAFLAGPDGTYGTGDDRRVYIRLAHEANGNWYPWAPAGGTSSAADYVRMWQHVHAMLTARGLDASHVQWVWAVNDTDVGTTTAAQLYPGDGYVDWMAVDGYNWGASQSWSSWQTPDQVFSPMLTTLRSLAAKPVAITEVASTSATTSGASVPAKSQWISSFFTYAVANGVQMVCWFNTDKETDWAVFGGGSGDTTYVSKKTTYRAYSVYRTAIGPLASSDATNGRLLTDAQFAGG